MDTLDNVAGLRKHAGHIDDMFGGVTDINIKRIREQNNRRISVIIGNPPYNANQLNENENNKNREYPEIDKRIKETYIAASNAQKTKLYDMYARFFRWASDRLDLNGVLAFISNRSFIDMRTFDGFRETIGKEFNEIYIVDLGGDVRANPKLSGTKHNVFGIQIGVCISFMIKRHKAKGCQIFYVRRPEFEVAEEKLAFLQGASASTLRFEEIKPDKNQNWLNLTSNDFESLLPLVRGSSAVAGKKSVGSAIFNLHSLGISTNRDDWLYDLDRDDLIQKTRFLVDEYERHDVQAKIFDTRIKWSETLKRRVAAGVHESFNPNLMRKVGYRPFCRAWLYQSPLLIDRPGAVESMFSPGTATNRLIALTQAGSQKPFMVSAIDTPIDLHYVGAAAGTECLPFYVYQDGVRTDAISDWALGLFGRQYQPGRAKKDRLITKEAIFHYVYAVLHDPVYLEKYALNLKREFPRIPFYRDFWQWANWGKTLMELHMGFEGVAPAKLKRKDLADEKAKKAGQAPKAILKADVDTGRIVVDSETTLAGIPPEAWSYRLGNRSGLEWVLDQHKESKPKDSTIREKFDTYRFADYKEKVIDLLARVTTVSVETQRIVEAMRKASR